jgi:leucyl aminopeptidase
MIGPPLFRGARSETAMKDPLAGEAQDGEAVTPIHVLAARDHAAAVAALGPLAEALASAQGFAARPGQVLAVLGADGAPGRLLAGVGALEGPAAALALRGLSDSAPAGLYTLADAPDGFDHALAALAFTLGGRVFERYKTEPAPPRARLLVRDAALRGRLQRIARACALARDMVDTPANDMGPAEIEAIARELAQAHGGQIEVTTGDALLAANYPAIHAVGRAAEPARAPRFVEMTWRGSAAGEDAPRVVLIGKGIVFDTGGLDIKPSAGMRHMKKDMGGSAHALALAAMVMGADLPLRLSVLLPIAENAISGAAMRPGDVLATRKGLSVEVGNTDAEGRLILADALTRAGELAPELTLDLATLTGAARAALGPEVPPFYTDDEPLAAEIAEASRAVHDPVWRLPLWSPYDSALDSDIADLKNDADAWAQAGSVTAALFLRRFAPTTGAWAHLDIFAWNPKKRAGWPVGGEAQAIRALFHLLERRYGAPVG